jgi:hypothetical protein
MKIVKLHDHSLDVPLPDGSEFVYFAGDSLRTYLGKSKFHKRPDCSLLVGKYSNKLVMEDMFSTPVDIGQRCKRCLQTKPS